MDHANLVFEKALELAVAASKVNLPCGDPVDLRIGLASGRSSAGVIGATGVTFVVTGKIAQGAKHFAEHTPFLTVSEDTWRKLSPANRSRGHWCRSSLSAIPTVGSLPCLDYHIRNPRPPPPPLPPPRPADPTYTAADVAEESLRLDAHAASQLPWEAFRHRGVEAAYRQWLARDLTGLEHVIVLLCSLVLVSAHLRVAPTGPCAVALVRCVCAAVPLLALLFQGSLQSSGLLLHEGAWLCCGYRLAMVVSRRALWFRPSLVDAGGPALLGSPLLPHLADLLDCLVGTTVFKARFTLQAVGCVVAWLATVVSALLQLQSGAARGSDMLYAWLLGSATLLLQGWLLARWERHKRRHFLRLVAANSAAKCGAARGGACGAAAGVPCMSCAVEAVETCGKPH